MNIVICAIAKLENNYIYDWAKYHLQLGFNHIYIYDNNDIDGELIEDVFTGSQIEDYITIIDVRGQKKVQLKVYNSFYRTYDFDWCAFIDIDEYISFNPDSNISQIDQLVSPLSEHSAIMLNWLCYGDCGHIYYEKVPVINRFQTPITPTNFVASLYNGTPENCHIKSIVKKGLGIDWEGERFPSPNPHIPANITDICNALGQPISCSPWQPINYDIAYIRHYITLSLEEYIRKIKRGSVISGSSKKYCIQRFFRYNRISIRKLYAAYRLSGSFIFFSVLSEKLKWRLISLKSPLANFYKSYRNHNRRSV